MRKQLLALPGLMLAVSLSAAGFQDPARDQAAASGPQTAVLAGGCFWGVEAVFESLNGVSEVVSGYAGGQRQTAHYEQVGTGVTGHAESVKITYDPARITYGELLKVFFVVAHDPTQVNRQGPDEGPQYRSDIFYANDDQKAVAEAYVRQLNAAHVFRRPIATRIDPLTEFFPAEAYHQNFLVRNPDNPYIVANDLPKLRALKATFPAMVKSGK
jgi:peptide-methionine (S)-S-oxide reductase